MHDDYALEVRRVTKDFGGLRAVDSVTLSVAVGERRVLIGPNGAGKTSLFHCISGAHTVSGGEILFFGRAISRLSEYERAMIGIGRTFQISSVFLDITVLENIQLAALGTHPRKWTWWKRPDEISGLNDLCMKVLDEVALLDRIERKVSFLSYGERRQLELALALVSRPKLLLLDEPCAGLSPAERQRLFSLIKALPRTITMVMIEHDMDVALGLADRVTVLHRGRTIVEGSADQIKEDPQVREVYFGEV